MKIIFGFLALIAWLTLSGSVSGTGGRSVVLVHGCCTASSTSWSQAVVSYKTAGYDVHAINLPKAGWNEGDSLINGRFVSDYLDTQNLVDAVLDSHSLGGHAVMYVAEVLDNPRVGAVILRDTNIATKGATSYGCWFVPDQCVGSDARAVILASIDRGLPTLVMNRGSILIDNSCERVYLISHNAFLTNDSVQADAETFVEGGDPCVQLEPEPEPCSWWDKWRGRC